MYTAVLRESFFVVLILTMQVHCSAADAQINLLAQNAPVQHVQHVQPTIQGPSSFYTRVGEAVITSILLALVNTMYRYVFLSDSDKQLYAELRRDKLYGKLIENSKGKLKDIEDAIAVCKAMGGEDLDVLERAFVRRQKRHNALLVRDAQIPNNVEEKKDIHQKQDSKESILESEIRFV